MAEIIEIPGGEGPVNEGERRVIAALLAELPASYLVAPNVEILETSGQRFEYDAIIVAPHAVYVIETKDGGGADPGRRSRVARQWLFAQGSAPPGTAQGPHPQIEAGRACGGSRAGLG